MDQLTQCQRMSKKQKLIMFSNAIEAKYMTL